MKTRNKIIIEPSDSRFVDELDIAQFKFVVERLYSKPKIQNNLKQLFFTNNVPNNDSMPNLLDAAALNKSIETKQKTEDPAYNLFKMEPPKVIPVRSFSRPSIRRYYRMN